jgi:hypothetical protein
MGNNFATDLANSDLDLSTAIGYHLQGNHYPPVPLIMVEPCIDAIMACWDNDADREISLPEGVTWRGFDKAPAHAVVSNHHLEPWI